MRENLSSVRENVDFQIPLLLSNRIPETISSSNSLLFPKVNSHYSSKNYNDLFFLCIFLVHILIISTLAVSYGILALQHYNPKLITVTNTDNFNFLKDKQNESLTILYGLVLSLFSSAILSFSWIYFLAKFASYFISSIMVIINLFTIVLSGLLIYTGLLILGISLMMFSLIIVFICLFLRPRISFAAINLKVSCEAILESPQIIINSLLVQSIQFMFILVWCLAVYGFATNYDDNYIYSSNNNQWYNLKQCTTYEYTNNFELTSGISLSCENNNNCQSCVCNGSLVYNNKSCFVMKIYPAVYMFLLFSLFWSSSVLSNVVHCSTSAIISIWWRTCNNDNINDNRNHTILKHIVTKSLGSICFGSLLVAIVRIMKTILTLIIQNLKKIRATSFLSYFQNCLLSLFSFILSVLDRIMTYFNRYAFCYVGIFGYDFLKSSKCAIELFQQKGWSILLNDDIIDFVIYLSNLLIGIISMLIGVLYCKLSGISKSQF